MLAGVTILLRYDAVPRLADTPARRILQLLLHGALEEPLASFTRTDGIVQTGGFIGTHDALDVRCGRYAIFDTWSVWCQL